MLEELKQKVYEANMFLKNNNLITLTWGNASGLDDTGKYMIIKPSGVSYEKMKPEDMVVIEILSGKVVEGNLNPSSDTPTHLYLYRSFPKIKGIVHTHSTWATVYAQRGENLKAMGTTHADTFYGDVPCTRKLTRTEVEEAYELNTGKVIVETFKNIDYQSVPAVFVRQHGPFTWGNSALDAAKNALILEEISKMGFFTKLNISEKNIGVDQYLLDKHYNRKHGSNAYYGQTKKIN